MHGEVGRKSQSGRRSRKHMDILIFFFPLFSFVSFALFFVCPSSDSQIELQLQQHLMLGNRLMKEKFIVRIFIFKASFQAHAERLQLEGESRLSAAIKISPNVSAIRDNRVGDP